MPRIGIVILCTRKYDIFLQQFIDSAEKFFFQGEQFDIYHFTDKPIGWNNDFLSFKEERFNAKVFQIPSYTFPWATLYRYKEITRYADMFDSDYLFYSDVDMRFVAPVGEEILCEGLTAVRHPGFHKSNGWGSPRTHRESRAYLSPNYRHDYYCGGFQGGSRVEYLKVSSLLSGMIDQDLETAKRMGYTENYGILADYHDETFFNWYCKMNPPKKVLDPEYCMVEQMELRKKWGIDDLTPRLIALSKDHKQIRS